MSKYLLYEPNFNSKDLDEINKAAIYDKILEFFKKKIEGYNYLFFIYPFTDDKLIISSKENSQKDLDKIPNTLSINDKISFKKILNESNKVKNGSFNLTNKSKSFQHYFEEKNLKLIIEKGDLLNQKVDIIVNPANLRLKLGGGVAGAISNRCGFEVQIECDNYLRKRNKPMSVSEVMHTSTNEKIYAKFIIHACGPCWDDYKNKEICIEDLKLTFFNTLMYMENILASQASIAIPLISSGVFGVPKMKCCAALYDALKLYIEKSDDSKRKLNLIKIVNIDDPTNDVLLEYFTQNPFESEKLKEPAIEKTKKSILQTNNEAESVEPMKKEKCIICEGAYELRYLEKTKCKCYYCFDCYPNYEQNKDCVCKLNLN